jgi:hypothetical protein
MPAKEPAMPEKPRTAVQIAAEAMRRADEAHTISAENNRLLKELHAGLMQPLPGYNKSFVERATEVVVEAEAGKIVGEKLVWYAKVLAAIGAIGAGLTALVTWGNPR